MEDNDGLLVADECLLNGGAVSSAVEHPLDMGKVTGSIPVPPTSLNPHIVILDLAERHRLLAANAGRRLDAGFIYVVEAIGLRRFKIGITEDLGNRFPRYATECPVECRPIIVATVPASAMRTIEKRVHSHYSAKRIRGEWFDLDERDLTDLADVLRAAARRPLADSARELGKLPRTSAERERQWKRTIVAAIGPDPVPTEEMVVDTLDYAAERDEVGVTYKDLARRLRGRVDLHAVVMSLLRRGVAAIVEPVRCDETAIFSISDLGRKMFCRPRWGCDWETSIEGVDVLVWESAESVHRVLSLVGSRRTIGGLQGRTPWRALMDQAEFELKRHGRPDG